MSNLQMTVNDVSSLPKWLQWAFKLSWYEWLAWIVEAALLCTFSIMTICEFSSHGARAGWVMFALSYLIAGPGIWILLGYKPKKNRNFERVDVVLLSCFAIWAVLLGLLTLWTVQF